jgi:simple sugar transport system permease protein
MSRAGWALSAVRAMAQRHRSTFVAAGILLLLFGFGGVRYDYFASWSNVANLFGDYAYVGVAAVGATFVILSGGIDLSVGSVVAFTSVLIAALVGTGWHPLAAGGFALAVGALIGCTMGLFIDRLELPAFMVTLAGMFAVRAGAFLIRDQSTGISHPFFRWLDRSAVIEVGANVEIPARTVVFIVVIAAAAVVAALTPFGRNVYALGGSEKAARAMGVPVGRTRVGVYTLSGMCSALAGFLFVMYKHAGDPISAVGLELTVIAAVVIGGTLLTGGVGGIAGTLIGVLILGVIRSLIDFEGNLNAAWTSIAIGVLLLLFVALQHLVGALGKRAAGRAGQAGRVAAGGTGR